MTPQKLKNSILQLAFLGKLTKQYTEDSSVDTLIENCKKDKIQAIKDGKIKKDSFNGALNDESYNIPDNWRLMYISDATLFQEGPGILAVDFRSSGIPLIRISGMQTDKVSLEGCNYLDPSMVEDKWKHFRLDVGDILISTSASMDKVCEVFDDCKGAIPYTGQIRFKMYGNISKEYFKWYVCSPLYNKQIIDQQAGAAIKHYGPTHLKKMTIPIAPVEEQKRIVAKIEELLPLIDRYEKAWTRLEDFNKRFPDDMQKSILQMAIQGKLVEQRPEEGTAEDLYKQIQSEKQSLIKAGKIKKEKPLPPISDDEIPFEIPSSWKWVRLGSILLMQPSNGISPKSVEYETPYKNLTLTATTSGYFKPSAFKYVELSEDIANKYWLENDDILIQRSNSRELVGTACIYRNGNRKYIYPDLMMRFHLLNGILVEFIDTVLKSPSIRAYYQKNASGTSESMPKINQAVVRETLIPLPPLAEQKRIVAKIEELLPLCERLK